MLFKNFIFISISIAGKLIFKKILKKVADNRDTIKIIIIHYSGYYITKIFNITLTIK